MSESATSAVAEAPPEITQRHRDGRTRRYSTELRERIRRAYLLEGLSPSDIAEREKLPNVQSVKNLVHREGWTRQKVAIEKRKEKAAERAQESVLARVEKQLEARAETAVAVFADSLEAAAEMPAGKRIAPLTEAKLALQIASDVSGRDRQSKDASHSIHLHLSSAWNPRRVDAIDVTEPATSLNSSEPAAGNQARVADVARPE